MKTYSMNHGALTMKDADGREITLPLDRGDLAVEPAAPKTRRALTVTGAFADATPITTTVTYSAEPLDVGAWMSAVSAPPEKPARHLVVMEGHRGRWLLRNCTTRMEFTEGEHVPQNPARMRSRLNLALTYAGAEWRRKAPARLRRLTAQRRMQAERKARRRYPLVFGKPGGPVVMAPEMQPENAYWVDWGKS